MYMFTCVGAYIYMYSIYICTYVWRTHIRYLKWPGVLGLSVINKHLSHHTYIYQSQPSNRKACTRMFTSVHTYMLTYICENVYYIPFVSCNCLWCLQVYYICTHICVKICVHICRHIYTRIIHSLRVEHQTLSCLHILFIYMNIYICIPVHTYPQRSHTATHRTLEHSSHCNIVHTATHPHPHYKISSLTL